MLVILGICFWEQLYNFFWYLDFSLTEKLKGNGWCSQERFRGRWNEILHLKHSVYSLTHCKSSVKLVCSYWGSTWPPLRQNSVKFQPSCPQPRPFFPSPPDGSQWYCTHGKEVFLNCLTNSALPSLTETEPQGMICLPESQDHRTLSDEKMFFTSTVG